MKRILLIDDDQALRALTRINLVSAGYIVKEAQNGPEGIAAALADPPELIICDVNLPGCSGYEVMATLERHTETADTPFIIITGDEVFSAFGRPPESIAHDFLLKPFNSKTLLETVSQKLRRHASLLVFRRTREQQLLSILETSNDLFALLEPETLQFSYLNTAGQLLLNTAGLRGELGLSNLLAACGGTPTLEEVKARLQSHKTWTGEMRLHVDMPKAIMLSAQLRLHPAQGGQSAYVTLGAHDITVMKLQEMQLNQAQRLESLGELAAGIAHEINTPTQYVSDNVQFVQRVVQELFQVAECHTALATYAKSQPELPEAIRRSLERCSSARIPYLLREIPLALNDAMEGLERVTKIVRAMKQFSHPGVDDIVMVDVNKAIESTLAVSRNEWKYVADVVLELDPNLPSVPCRPGELNQVILNLVINAAHAIADVVGDGVKGKGRITLRSAVSEGMAQILVEDTGTGIPEHVQQRIFDPFFTTKAVGRGTGQGLTLARSIIVDHFHGSLDFTTRIGAGTCFRIRLPLTQPVVNDMSAAQ